MIRYQNPSQLALIDFEWPFQTGLDENNRWVKLSHCLPWEKLADSYYQSFKATTGRPPKDARLVIGAVIIKHKLQLSDRETVAQIQENPYLQYFVGLPGYQSAELFAPSLFVEIRKRMGQSVFDGFQQAIVDATEERKSLIERDEKATDSDDEPPSSSVQDGSSVQGELLEDAQQEKKEGKLIIDATVAPQAIRYPTDLSLLNEAREFTEQIIDELYERSEKKGRKPRTYRVKARKAYLAIAKQKRPGIKIRRKGVKQQLQYLRRNLRYIEQLLKHWPEGEPVPLPDWLMRRYWVIPHLYAQQKAMYDSNTKRCDDRIVSISQPHVRPIVRGKQNKPVEFGAKLSVSLTADGIACVDRLSWDAYHEGHDLVAQVERYRERLGYYPEVVYADPAYGSHDNRRYLKKRGIRFAGKPLGRPKKETEENREVLREEKAQRQADYRQRIPIEGKFGQGKNGYGLNYIRAKRADTSVAWINSIFLVMNLAILLQLFFALVKSAIKFGWIGTILSFASRAMPWRFRFGQRFSSIRSFELRFCF